MPVYNAGKYLATCLDSIVSQSYKNWELLAIDDFSTDNSLDLLSRFAAKDERIKVLQNNRKGIIPALQLGYQQSTGEYITRMDADDIMPIQKLELLLEGAADNENTISVGKVEYFADDKKLNQGYEKYAEWLNDMLDTKSHFENIYKECVIPSPCWMMSKETFERIGGFKSKSYPEDYDLSFRIYQYKINIIGINKVLHLWRDHDARASRNDPNYKVQSFLPLKLMYFFEIDYKPEKTLALWGCGTTGKSLAKLLIEREQEFIWLTDNPNKIGLDIYGIKIQSNSILKDCKSLQIITAIKAKKFHQEEKSTFAQLLKNQNKVFHFH